MSDLSRAIDKAVDLLDSVKDVTGAIDDVEGALGDVKALLGDLEIDVSETIDLLEKVEKAG